MASRAHAVRHYSIGNVATQPQRDVWYRREDPVVLPRSRGWSLDYRLVAAALAASALVTAATYALFYTAPPTVAETAELPFNGTWSLSTDTLESAHVTRALSGPAFAARDVPSAQQGAEPEVFFDEAAAAAEQQSSSNGMSTAPELSPAPVQPLSPPEVYPKPSVPTDTPRDVTPAPYPNPTTTPPDAVAPPEMSPLDAPKLDSENPYR